MRTAMSMIMNFEFGPDTHVDIEKLMKVYGKQCAERALKDAAVRKTNFDQWINVDQILSTPILTP